MAALYFLPVANLQYYAYNFELAYSLWLMQARREQCGIKADFWLPGANPENARRRECKSERENECQKKEHTSSRNGISGGREGVSGRRVGNPPAGSVSIREKGFIIRERVQSAHMLSFSSLKFLVGIMSAASETCRQSSSSSAQCRSSRAGSQSANFA